MNNRKKTPLRRTAKTRGPARDKKRSSPGFYRMIVVALIAATLIFITVAVFLDDDAPTHIYVNDIEMIGMAGSGVDVGGGFAWYDAGTNTLTLDSVTLDQTKKNAPLSSDGTLNLVIEGDCSFTGGRFGIHVEGSLTVRGSGTATIFGNTYGIKAKKFLADDLCDMTITGGRSAASSPGEFLGGYTVTDVAGHEIESLKNVSEANARSARVVSFDTLGGSEIESKTAKIGSATAEPDEIPTLEDHRFDGWAVSDKKDAERYDFSSPVMDDVTLYAVWVRQADLVFDSWGGSAIETETVDIGDAAPAPASDPVRDGYVFEGWYADAELTIQYDFDTVLTEDTEAYAKWTRIADAVYMGIDISQHQKTIDFAQVKAAGVDFAIIRAGYRGYGEAGTLNADELFAQNYQGAKANGLNVGAYIYSQATSKTEAVEEADYLISRIAGCTFEMPLVLDFEFADDGYGNPIGRLYEAKLSAQEMAEICIAFCDRISEAGYTPMVYANLSMLESGIGDALDQAGYSVWLANWSVQTGYNGDYYVWQYSSSGSIPGIAGRCDVNLRYINPQ